MSYNERQLYCTENLEPTPVLSWSPGSPWPAQTPERTGSFAVQTYPDGTPKPIFMHHGPELSGIGTKLLAGRTPEQARALAVRLAQRAAPLQLLHADAQPAPDRPAGAGPGRVPAGADARGQQAGRRLEGRRSRRTTRRSSSELIAFFLRSRFSVKTAEQKAVEEFDTDAAGKQADGEITKLAVDALTTPATPKDEAAAKVKQMKLVREADGLAGQEAHQPLRLHELPPDQRHGDRTSPCANLSDWGQKASTSSTSPTSTTTRSRRCRDTYKSPMVNGL